MMLNKIPTGIKTFDININDGFPAGSVILLLEDIGAGAREFIYTSIFNISKLKSDNHAEFMKRYKSNDTDDIVTVPVLPGKVCYMSVSRSLEDILKENAYAFRKDFYNSLQGVIFKDFSDMYFRHSIVHDLSQDIWAEHKKDNKNENKKENIGVNSIDSSGSNSGKKILEEISRFLGKNAENNIVVLDSLTDLMLYDDMNKTDIIMFLKGLVRMSKVWNGIIYIILGADILDNKMQEIIKDNVDGVLVFEWYDKGSDKMRRNLYMSKFKGLIPRLEQNKIAKFETKVTYDNGFEVSNVRKII